MKTTGNAAREPARLRETERTALAALIAGTPSLMVTAAAAASANALAVWADLMLSVIDMAALAAVWRTSRHRTDSSAAETRALVFVAACMAASLAIVTGLAGQRLLGGGTPLEGPGIQLALAQNAGFAVVNAWLLGRWRRRMRAAPSAVVRSQLRLFSDKLACNLILTASLAASLVVGDVALASALDAATGVLLVVMSAWWFAPVLAGAWQQLVRPA
jgi:hypothetical protein